MENVNKQEQKLFKTPFTPGYWKTASGELKSVKMIVIAAVFIALRTAVARFFIPLPVMGGQRIYFTFFVNALGTVIYGPVVGGLASAVSDLIGAIFFPTGPFFFGYTITSFMGSFIYGLFFYKTKISVAKIFCAKLTVNAFVNVFLGSLWPLMMNKTFSFPMLLTSMIARTPKNIIMLPFETIIMYLFISLVLPILKREKLIKVIPYDKKIGWF